jgi:hypothetical protein
VVRAAVPEGELERLVPRRQSEQLVAKTDADDRHLPEQARDGCNLVVKRPRIAGTVREQDAVVARELIGVDAVWEDRHLRPGARKPPQDRALAAVVDDSHSGSARVAVNVRFLRRDLRHECAPLHRRLLPHGHQRLFDSGVADHDRGQHRSVLA